MTGDRKSSNFAFAFRPEGHRTGRGKENDDKIATRQKAASLKKEETRPHRGGVSGRKAGEGASEKRGREDSFEIRPSYIERPGDRQLRKKRKKRYNNGEFDPGSG